MMNSACYDRGSICRQKCLLNDRDPYPIIINAIIGMLLLFGTIYNIINNGTSTTVGHGFGHHNGTFTLLTQNKLLPFRRVS